MADLIDRAALLEKKTCLWDDALGWTECVDIDDIEAAATVDAVKVVRCKDCQYKDAWQRINELGVAVYICDASGMILVDDLAFCSFGERRTDADNRC